ncbi:oligosaccharide flippase family protein [Azoarcus sp. L1K30]|nr:oligosaccharide flippase family protein [Azoarcus sp. L1K30]
MTMKPAVDARKSMISGALWTVSMRWGMKLLGLVSTIILARLILPQEYAVVAMAMLVVGLIESFLDFGTDTAVLRKDYIDDDYVNSAWSLKVLQGAFVAVLLVIGAYFAGIYFGDERVPPVLWILAGCVFLASTGNIGMTLARRNLNFSLDFKLQVTSKVIAAILTISAAFFLRDYRALVLGVVSGYVGGWILSYLMHPYRPRWCVKAFADIWGVTRWLMLSSIAGFMLQKADELVAARIGTSHEFGLYNVGADIGQMPTGEIGPAILKSLLPVLSSIQNESERLKSGVLKVLAIVNAVTLPAGFGLAAVALPFTLAVLGESWREAAPIVALFGIAGAARVMVKPLSTILVLKGFTRCQSRIVWIEFVVFALSAVVLVPQFHLLGLIVARIAGTLTSALLIIYEAHRRCYVPVQSSLNMLWRPLCSAITMYFAIKWMQQFISTSMFGLVAEVVAGAFVYGLLMLISWLLSGKPVGVEFEFVRFVGRRRSQS